MDEAMIYETCPNHDTAKSPTGNCLFCGGVGFVPIGISKMQVERWATMQRALQGDPGVPTEKRHTILTALHLRVQRALAALEKE